MTISIERAPNEPDTDTPPAPAKRTPKDSQRAGIAMVSPAMFLILFFLIVPFGAAFYFSFTNQRLVSPNPTEYVGNDQFARLLAFEWVTLEPAVDPETGELLRDEDGELEYPLRDTIRNNPDNPQFDGLEEFWSISRGNDQRTFFLVGDKLFVRSLLNTFYFALVVVPLQSLFGLMLALLVNQKIRGINIFRSIFFMPVVTSMVVISILWRFIYDGNNGLLNSALSWLTLGGFDGRSWLADTSTALPAVIGMSIWQAVGFHMIIWLAGLQTIPSVLYEASSIDGAGRWHQFRHVTWPGLRPTRIFVLVTITIAAMGLFTQIDVMTNGGPLDSTSTVIFYAVRQGWGQQNIAYGSAISLVFFCIVLTIALIQAWLTRKDPTKA